MNLYTSLRFWTAYHPYISTFRWDHLTWCSSWSFLALSILLYLFLTSFLRVFLSFRKTPIPLGPLPAIYNLVLFLVSLCLFVGCWQAAVEEIRETHWLWRRSKTVPEWILCFPLGTRPAGRVFFWSYVYYLSKYYEFLDTFILILTKQPVSGGHLFRHAAAVLLCFMWLEFSQSLQILALLVNTGIYVLLYMYSILWRWRWVPPWRDIVKYCQIARFVIMAAASMLLLELHFKRGGCKGFGAWLFNAVVTTPSILLFMINNRRPKLTKPNAAQGSAKEDPIPFSFQCHE